MLIAAQMSFGVRDTVRKLLAAENSERISKPDYRYYRYRSSLLKDFRVPSPEAQRPHAAPRLALQVQGLRPVNSNKNLSGLGGSGHHVSGQSLERANSRKLGNS